MNMIRDNLLAKKTKQTNTRVSQVASGILWSQLLRASTPTHLCVRKLFIGKIYYTLDIQGIYLCRVMISNDENYSVGVDRASIRQVIVLWISDDPSHHLVQSFKKE